jgi:hypothetical protein
MRKIESQMIAAIKARKDWQNGNTSVHVEDNYITVRLHEYKIAEVKEKEIILDSCGWRSKITKSRLNAILDHYNKSRIYQEDFVWMYRNEEFEDGMIVAI